MRARGLIVAAVLIVVLHHAAWWLLHFAIPISRISFWRALLLLAQPRWSPATEECRLLRRPAAPPGTPPYGRLRLSRHDQLTFDHVVSEPLAIFFRYSGSSRHGAAGTQDVRTPLLGAWSLMRALHSLSPEQLRNTSITILLNGGANTSSNKAWFHKLLPPKLRQIRLLASPHGNQASYDFQLDQVLTTGMDVSHTQPPDSTTVSHALSLPPSLIRCSIQ